MHTLEHFMSALCGMGITNIIAEVNSDELPILDGSSLGYIEAITRVGIIDQDIDATFFTVESPIGVEDKEAAIYIVPSDNFYVSYMLSYKDSFLKDQYFSTKVTSDIYKKEISPCRTFCLESEIDELRIERNGKRCQL